jgi:hypothetical protein
MSRFKRNLSAVLVAIFFVANLPLALAEENDSQLISMDFEDAPIKNVLKILSQQSALNFVASDGIESKKVTVYFEDVSVQDALDSIVSANGLRYEKKNQNLYIIYPAESANTGTETKVFYLKYTRLSASPIDIGGGEPVTFKKGEPMFANVDEILQGLDRDRISYLYEMQQRIQEDHGLRKERLSQEEMLAAMAQIATSEVGDANLPFWKWGPSLRASFMHFLASMLYFSHQDKSLSGTSSESSAKNDSPTSQKPE